MLFVKEEINKIVKDESLQNVPFLLYYNKQDLLGKCKSKEELNTRLAVGEISQQREVSLQECSAISGIGIWEGLDKLILILQDSKKGGQG